jgi:hypothetical protein
MKDHESIEEMYNRLLSIQNEFSDLGEPLTNNKVVGKILRVMLRRPRWKALVSTLEAMQGTKWCLYAGWVVYSSKMLWRKIEASGKLSYWTKASWIPRSKQCQAFSPINLTRKLHSITWSWSFKRCNAPLKNIPKMLNFEKKFNKEREENNKNVIYFGCHKEGHKEWHIIHSCFLSFFSHIKGTDGTSRQDQKNKFSKYGFKGRKKAKVVNAIWDVDSDDDNNDSDNEASHSQEANFTLIVTMKDISSGMDVETIIISKNIIDPITIDILRKIAESNKFKTQQSTMICAQPTVQVSLKQPSSNSQEGFKVAHSTSILEVVKESIVSFSTSTTLEEQLVSPPKVNYFPNLPSDSDESDD